MHSRFRVRSLHHTTTSEKTFALLSGSVPEYTAVGFWPQERKPEDDTGLSCYSPPHCPEPGLLLMEPEAPYGLGQAGQVTSRFLGSVCLSSPPGVACRRSHAQQLSHLCNSDDLIWGWDSIDVSVTWRREWWLWLEGPAANQAPSCAICPDVCSGGILFHPTPAWKSAYRNGWW